MASRAADIEARKLARTRCAPYINGMICDDGLAGYPVHPTEISLSASSVSNRTARLNTLPATMAAFDKLPRRVREALANGVENWSPQAVTLVMRGRGLVDFGAVDIIETWNAKELGERDRHRAAAIGVYRGNVQS